MDMSPTKKGALNIILNATSEFCRSLGDIPTYGQAGNREEDKDELVVCIQYYCMITLWTSLIG